MNTKAEKAIQEAIVETFEEVGHGLTEREQSIVEYSVAATVEVIRSITNEEETIQ